MKKTCRASGILLPIFSLPSDYGIGTFGEEAYKFVDMLKNAKQKYWQILPLCPTSYGDSPYQSFSTFAGNPYFIDLDTLISEGLLSKDECSSVDFGDNPVSIDYGKLYFGRYPLLKKAFVKSKHQERKEFKEFCRENEAWLQEYCLFMAVKGRFGNVSWLEWNEDIKARRPDALKCYTKEMAEEIDFHKFMQYQFFKQWSALKKYANENGIKIFGDLPIYVAMDSADVWSNPSLFLLDEDLNPESLAGVPPDSFSDEGQLWGNPLYNWRNHKKSGYSWWMNRIAHSAKLYDTLRIDHFRGFDAYWAVPHGEKNAVNGEWRKGPGIDLFQKIKKQLGEIDIIAEDLGVQTDSLRILLSETGYPGMKVMQFGFGGEDNEHLPHNYPAKSVAYTGTHDNTTLSQWYNELPADNRELLNLYCRVTYEDPISDIIATVFQSTANLVIIPLQDYLGLGGEARINTPSTLGDNWKWRLEKGRFTSSIQNHIAQLTETFFR